MISAVPLSLTTCIPHTQKIPMHEAETRCVYALDALQALCVGCQRVKTARENSGPGMGRSAWRAFLAERMADA